MRLPFSFFFRLSQNMCKAILSYYIYESRKDSTIEDFK